MEDIKNIAMVDKPYSIKLLESDIPKELKGFAYKKKYDHPSYY